MFLVSAITKESLNKGEAIEAAMLKAPSVVEQGAIIRVVAATGGASVSVEAIAEKRGRWGENIFVRNRESGKRIRVLLTDMGEARAAVSGAQR